MERIGTVALDAAIEIDRGRRHADEGFANVRELALRLRDLEVADDPSLCHAVDGLLSKLGHEAGTVDDVVGILAGYSDRLTACEPGDEGSTELVAFCLALHGLALSEWQRRYGGEGWLGLAA